MNLLRLNARGAQTCGSRLRFMHQDSSRRQSELLDRMSETERWRCLEITGRLISSARSHHGLTTSIWPFDASNVDWNSRSRPRLTTAAVADGAHGPDGEPANRALQADERDGRCAPSRVRS
jgi:hypothetical protein